MQISLFSEVKRKLIHLLAISLLIPILFFSREISIILIGITFLLLLICEVTRSRNMMPGKFVYDAVFSKMMRINEMESKFTLKGADQMILGLLLLCIFFKKDIISASFLILCISDAFAALVGRFCGKVKIYNSKTLEGYITFALCTVAILCFIFNKPLLPSIVIAFILAAIELFDVYRKINLDDNLILPLASAVMINVIY